MISSLVPVHVAASLTHRVSIANMIILPSRDRVKGDARHPSRCAAVSRVRRDADTVFGVMLTIEGVAQALGVSVRAVRLRRDALCGVIDEHIRRGDHNELLFGDGAFAILRRVEDVRRGESISLRQAVERVRGELQGNGDTASRQAESPITASGEAAILQRVIEDQREEIAFLRRQVETLTQLALPSPRRRPWWPFGRRASSG